MPLQIACRADEADEHQHDVNALLFHKGKLYSCGDDSKIKVWAPDLKFLQEVKGHHGAIYSLAASDDTLYSCSGDGVLKSWDLNTLTEKSFTIVEEEEIEYWQLQYNNGFLYVGDDTGNITIYKNEEQYGVVSVAMGVKDLLLKNNFVLVAKDNDVVVNDLNVEGDRPKFSVKDTIMGRGPLVLIDDKCIFMNREGKDIILHSVGSNHQLTQLSKVANAHKMIVQGATALNWDGSTLLFTAGWDKVVKQWKLEGDTLKADGVFPIEFVINTLTQGESGQIYAAGADGHLVRLDL